MKHPARWLIALALLACALAWWWNAPPPEPVYDGKPLSRWLREFAFHPSDALPEPFSSAGPAEVKWLAYIAEHGRSLDHPSGSFQRLFAQLRWWDMESKSTDVIDQRISAINMLAELGPKARPAIPALVRVLNKDSYDQVYSAARALHLLEPDSWPVVEDQLIHGSNLARCGLLNTMWQRYQNDSVDDFSKVFHHLADALHDPEPNIRRNAASSLAEATSLVTRQSIPGALLDQAAATLWPLDGESNKEVREAKQAILSYYRETKADALPRLTALLTDPDESKRNFARAILAEIEPAATKAEAP